MTSLSALSSQEHSPTSKGYDAGRWLDALGDVGRGGFGQDRALRQHLLHSLVKLRIVPRRRPARSHVERTVGRGRSLVAHVSMCELQQPTDRFIAVALDEFQRRSGDVLRPCPPKHMVHCLPSKIENLDQFCVPAESASRSLLVHDCPFRKCNVG